MLLAFSVFFSPMLKVPPGTRGLCRPGERGGQRWGARGRSRWVAVVQSRTHRAEPPAPSSWLRSIRVCAACSGAIPPYQVRSDFTFLPSIRLEEEDGEERSKTPTRPLQAPRPPSLPWIHKPPGAGGKNQAARRCGDALYWHPMATEGQLPTRPAPRPPPHAAHPPPAPPQLLLQRLLRHRKTC